MSLIPAGGGESLVEDRGGRDAVLRGLFYTVRTFWSPAYPEQD